MTELQLFPSRERRAPHLAGFSRDVGFPRCVVNGRFLTLEIKQRLEIKITHRGAVGEKPRRQLVRLAEERRVGSSIRRTAKSSIRRRKINHVENIVGKRAQSNAVAAIDARTWAVRAATASP